MKDWTPEGKTTFLRGLYKEWADCTKCGLSEHRTNIVFGNGNPDADIMLIGEAPGGDEDAQGDAFIGRAGKLLTAICEQAGLDREHDLFIANMVMCRPPGNRDPVKLELDACWDRLHAQIYSVDPMLIIPVGAVAMQSLMGGEWKAVTSCRGKFGFVEIKGRSEHVVSYSAMPILHPAFILREDRITREGNWQSGGHAHQTVRDLKRAKERVDWLKKLYTPVRKRLRVIQ